MDKNNVTLSDIVPFKEGECWYLKLIYKYEDDKGKHVVVIPKAAIPFTQCCLPYVTTLDPYYRCSLKRPFINCDNSMPLYDSVCDLAIERGVKEPAIYFDIITKYATKEMTLDEIEKKLGYKVKIINKEDK